MKKEDINNARGKVIAVDIDGTLTKGTAWNAKDVIMAEPRLDQIEMVNKWFKGNFIVIHTARRHELYQSTIDWLAQNGVRYHAIRMEKMAADFYYDDKSINPNSSFRRGIERKQ